MKTRTCFGLALVGLLAIYIGSYLGLSLGGRYEPGPIGLSGVKAYGWAPAGFVTDYRWNRTPMIVYFPLWALDRRCWHTDGMADSGRYPINRVNREDIWKVYKAYGF